jgi:CO/xanthine dehydrogenase Mo-binding subunit
VGQVIGLGQRRLEGRQKVTGSTMFTADLRMDRLVEARLVLSPWPAARIIAIETAEAAGAPGVIGVFTGADFPDVAVGGADQPLAQGRVYYAGQPVAVVVATDRYRAADAAALVRVSYERTAPVVDPFAAMVEGTATVVETSGGASAEAAAHGAEVGGSDEPTPSDGTDGGAGAGLGAEPTPAPNVTYERELRKGDARTALAGCAATVHLGCEVARVHQGYLEPHVAIAAYGADDRYTVWTPIQAPFWARQELSDLLGVPVSRIRVVPMPVGGAFGGKLGCLVEPLAALVARRIGRPVRLELTRMEDFLVGRVGAGSVLDIELGADREGVLKALAVDVVIDNGAGEGGEADLCATQLTSIYRIPDLDIRVRDVATHKTPAGAYRAPAAPAAAFALESAMDELARRLAQDPLELRLRNALREGDLLADGSTCPRIGLVECLEAAREHPLYTAPREAGEGIGVAAGVWRGGLEPARAVCRIQEDGTLSLQVGSVDLSGSDTTLAMIAAETFGLPVGSVRVDHGDTDLAPRAGAAAASKTTYTVGLAVERAAADARRQLFEVAAAELEAAVGDLEIAQGSVRVKGSPDRGRTISELVESVSFGSPFGPLEGTGRSAQTIRAPMSTVHLARVRLDRSTGRPAITGYAAIQDVGRALNPPEIEGQIQGGVAQGLGRVLGEELAFDSDGQPLSVTFMDYLLPAAPQIPDVDVRLIEVPSPAGPYGARGVAEPPVIPGAAALGNAIRDACGMRPTVLPVRPWELLEPAG